MEQKQASYPKHLYRHSIVSLLDLLTPPITYVAFHNSYEATWQPHRNSPVFQEMACLPQEANLGFSEREATCQGCGELHEGIPLGQNIFADLGYGAN